MIFKVDCNRAEDYHTHPFVYTVYKKPFKLWPVWKLEGIFYTIDQVGAHFRELKENPLYEGTLDQISAQVKA